MRGMLRIASSRAPYQRAGIGFATKAPQDVDIRTLDGARFLRLIKDPVLTLKIGQEDGTFVAMPQVPDDVTAELLELMIASMVEELPDLPAAPIPVLPDGVTLEGFADRLMEAGVANIDQLFDKLAAKAAVIVRLERDYKELREHADKQIAELESRAAELIERDNELRLSRERVAELEAAVNAASSSQPAAEEQPQETKPAPRKAAAKKG